MSDIQPKIRIVIADDHALVRDGLRKLLDTQPEMVVVGEASNGLEAIQRTEELRPDVLLLDLAMPRLNGLEVLKALGDGAGKPKVVLLTATIEREETTEALKLGARGVVLKESATQMLYRCIRAVTSGEFWVGHERIDDLVQTLRRVERRPEPEAPSGPQLTARERQVVAAIVDGASNKDIGKDFGLSEQTVKNHLSRIFDKLGVSNRLELALYAVHHRLLADDGVRQPASTTPSRRDA